jgi:transcriptional regulator with XRE-family HTH domain/mannose-6-phosphate isomerase-like protein (cupin superfamily)
MVDEQMNRNLQHLRERLRDFRRQRRYSLRELAARADVSASLLSQIENGKANPSVMVLHSIASALNVPLMYFFPPDQETASAPILDLEAMSTLTPSQTRAAVGINLPADSKPFMERGTVALDFLGQSLAPDVPLLLRQDHRASIELQGGVIWERLTAMGIKGIEFLHIEYGTGASSGAAMSRHRGSEFGYILEGQLTLNLGFDEYQMVPGDSVVFNSNTPHRLTNSGECTMRAIWVIFDLTI